MAAMNAVLIDYEFCTGCRSCEVACQMGHDYPVGQSGLIVQQIGPKTYANGKLQYDFIPQPTEACVKCADRVAAGKRTLCEQHCQAQVIKIGPLDELMELMGSSKKQVLYYKG